MIWVMRWMYSKNLNIFIVGMVCCLQTQLPHPGVCYFAPGAMAHLIGDGGNWFEKGLPVDHDKGVKHGTLVNEHLGVPQSVV